MKYFSYKKFNESMTQQGVINDLSIFKKFDGIEVKDGRVSLNGSWFYISDNWTIEKKIYNRYYFILKGKSGYRAIYHKSERNHEFYESGIVKQNTSDKVNEMFSGMIEEADYFTDTEQLKEHLIDNAAKYIYLFEADQWYKTDKNLQNRTALTGITRYVFNSFDE